MLSSVLVYVGCCVSCAVCCVLGAVQCVMCCLLCVADSDAQQLHSISKIRFQMTIAGAYVCGEGVCGVCGAVVAWVCACESGVAREFVLQACCVRMGKCAVVGALSVCMRVVLP